MVQIKSDELEVGENVMQARQCAEKLQLEAHLKHQRKSHLPNLIVTGVEELDQ